MIWSRNLGREDLGSPHGLPLPEVLAVIGHTPASIALVLAYYDAGRRQGELARLVAGTVEGGGRRARRAARLWPTCASYLTTIRGAGSVATTGPATAGTLSAARKAVAGRATGIWDRHRTDAADNTL